MSEQRRLNQFTGCSDKTLKIRLANNRKALDDFYADPDAGGGGSPTEGLRDRIADLEEEIERRAEASRQALYALSRQE